jgi:beta-lactamase regulating signal transducer with metallopeptidase domain
LHLRRRDPLAAAGSLAVRILWWFHPAAHLASARLADLREIGCDQDVVRALGGRTEGYQRTLVRIAVPSLMPVAPVSMAFFSRRSVLVDRIEALQHAPAKGGRAGRSAAMLGLALLLACAVPGPPPEPEPRMPAAILPGGVSWPDLQGCLQKRWFITGLLAQKEAALRN